ncbi:MAG: DUF4159 domain-containing protein [Pirellula sp.]|jgi:hypothetical protein
MSRWIRPRWLVMCCLLTLSMATIAAGYQRRWRQDWRSVGRQGVPTWEVEKPFAKDVFTFARVKYNSYGYRDKWAIDFRDSDLNFSLRLQQMTTIKVNPEPVVVELTDPNLFDYPFLYMIEPGELFFSPEEAKALRQYLLNGGFMMVDDFWGDEEYNNFASQMKMVFPELEPEVVPLEHDIFQCVYSLKEKPQIPSVGIAQRGAPYGITWESRYGSDTSKANYRAIYDKAGRIMVFICHNTDLGDGWEQEGVDPWYFENFSVKKAYPMGINIATYAMTH